MSTLFRASRPVLGIQDQTRCQGQASKESNRGTGTGRLCSSSKSARAGKRLSCSPETQAGFSGRRHETPLQKSIRPQKNACAPGVGHAYKEDGDSFIQVFAPASEDPNRHQLIRRGLSSWRNSEHLQALDSSSLRYLDPLITISEDLAKPLLTDTMVPKVNTSIRWQHLAGLLFLQAMLCAMAGWAFNIALVPMSVDFGWGVKERGYIMAGQVIGSTLSMVAGGVLAAKKGGKVVMGVAVAWWAVCTLLTPTAAGVSLKTLMILRATMGIGEGLMGPAGMALLPVHVPEHARSKAVGMIGAGAGVGFILALVVTPTIILHGGGWPSLFYLFGSLATAWCGLWYHMAPAYKGGYSVQEHESPTAQSESDDGLSEKGKVGKAGPRGGAGLRKSSLVAGLVMDAETKGGGKEGAVSTETPLTTSTSTVIPWGKFFRSKGVWAILGASVIGGSGTAVTMTFLPSFLSSRLKLGVDASSALLLGPFCCMVVATLAAGVIADALLRQGWDKAVVRKLMQTIAFLGPALAMLGLVSANTVSSVVLLLSLLIGVGAFGAAGGVVNTQDLAVLNTGPLQALFNTVGSVSGAICIAYAGTLLDATGNWASIWLPISAMYMIAAVWYCCLASAKQEFE